MKCLLLKLMLMLTFLSMTAINLQSYKFDIDHLLTSYDIYQIDAGLNRLASIIDQDYEFVKFIYDISFNYGIDHLLIVSLIKIESDFREDAKSKTGAVGYCQITPIAVKDISSMLNRHEPEENIIIGVQFMRKLIDRYGDVSEALAHYNYGSKDAKQGKRYAQKVLKYYDYLKEKLDEYN